MSTGPFIYNKVQFCPFCGNEKRFDYRRGGIKGTRAMDVGTQGCGSGEHDIVCDACGFDGGVQTLSARKMLEPKKEVAPPRFCPMCGHQKPWQRGIPWALSCEICGWMGDMSIYDDIHDPYDRGAGGGDQGDENGMVSRSTTAGV